jgi:hypothetical protein
VEVLSSNFSYGVDSLKVIRQKIKDQKNLTKDKMQPKNYSLHGYLWQLFPFVYLQTEIV